MSAESIRYLERPHRKLSRRSKRKLIVLVPSADGLGTLRTEVNPERHAHFLAQLQLLRRKVYVDGGFLNSHDLQRGNWAPLDPQSWHLLSVGDGGQVCGCLRLRPHRTGACYSDLTVSRSPISSSRQWGGRIMQAVNHELWRACRRGFRFFEVGGWALDQHARGSSEAVRMALASFAFGELIGGAIGVTTARERGSAPILRKIGGKPIEEVPPYYDQTYRCKLEILRLHSWDPHPRFKNWIGEIMEELARSPVIARHASPTRAPIEGHAHRGPDLSDRHGAKLKISSQNDDVQNSGWKVPAGQFYPDISSIESPL
jgi:hypothetical protein